MHNANIKIEKGKRNYEWLRQFACSSESEIGDDTGIFWHKTDSGTNVYLVDDTEDPEMTTRPQSEMHADREGQGKLRRIRLSEAIKQQDNLEKRIGQPLEGSSGNSMNVA